MELNSNQIQEIIPHRYPFLLVDRVLEMEPGKYCKAIKNVSVNESQFLGHFPEEHVMPGVLIIEALAQAGALIILSLEENKGKIAYFAGIDKCKFKQKVVPGDTLIFKCDLITPIRRGICHMQGYAYANGKLCAEAELMAQISKVK